MKFQAKLPSGTSLKRTVNSTGTGATGSGVSVVKTSDRRCSPGRRPAESNVTVTGSVLPTPAGLEPPPEPGIVPDAGSSESHGMSVDAPAALARLDLEDRLVEHVVDPEVAEAVRLEADAAVVEHGNATARDVEAAQHA